MKLQHINYFETLGLFLRRFGAGAAAFDASRGVWIDAAEIEALRARAAEYAYTAGCNGGRWKGGAYITEARPCYIKFGAQFAVAVTMVTSAPTDLPEITMYWLVEHPPVDLS